MVRERQGSSAGIFQRTRSTSIKLYQCSILLGDWKHEFCFGSGRTIFIRRTDDEDEAPTLRAMI